MDLKTFKSFMAIGALLNSALYLSGCLIAGLVVGNGFAWRLALAAMGMTYVSYLAQFVLTAPEPSNLASGLVWFSIILGAVAGTSLLF
ncbi:MAG TPA: hypothetical protein VNH21_14260 [Steroidobacteraceae bacterium]|nr:hypothetical protein [Steroidobacteraceae bacterium]